MRGVVLLFSLFSIAFGGGKLSEAENLERSQTCGTVLQKKVFNGADALPKEAPWMAIVNYKSGQNQFYAGASMLSSRHVLTEANVFFTFDKTDTKYKWRLDGAEVDQNACQNGVMQIPSKYATQVSINACGHHQKCYEDSSRIIGKRAVFLGSCFQHDVNYGMVLIETETDFAMDSGITPLCVGGTVVEGDTVEMYGFGTKTGGTTNSATVQLTKGTTKVTSCAGKYFPDISICLENINCDGDMGSTYVKKMNDRMTAMAVVYYTACKSNSIEPHISVDVFSSQICEFSGICAPNPSAGQPPKRQSGKLTDEENRHRAARCGSKVQSKIFGASYMPASNAPWAAMVHYDEGGKLYWYSASIVSKRHAIFYATSSIKDAGGSFQWIRDGTPVDVSLCKNGIMKISADVTGRLSVGTCAMSIDPDDCHQAENLKLRSATYIGSCESLIIGIILVELEVDVNQEHVGYLCVPDSPVTAIGDELKTYSVGATTTSNQIKPRVNTGSAKVANCNPGKFNDLLMCASGPGGCTADGGAAYSKSVNGKEMLVATLMNGNCAQDGGIMQHISIEKLSNLICDVSGICKPKALPAPPPPGNGKGNGGSGQQGNDKKSGGQDGDKGSDKGSDSSSSDQEDGAPGAQILGLLGLFALFFYF